MLASNCKDLGSAPEQSMRELWCTEWHWDRYVMDRVALGQVCGGQSGTGTGL